MKSKVSDICLKLLHPRYHCSDFVVYHEVCVSRYQLLVIISAVVARRAKIQDRHSYPSIIFFKETDEGNRCKKEAISLLSFLATSS